MERNGHVLVWIGSATELRNAAREERAAEVLEIDLVTDFHEGKRNDAWLRRNALRTAPLLAAALRRASAAPPVR